MCMKTLNNEGASGDVDENKRTRTEWEGKRSDAAFGSNKGFSTKATEATERTAAGFFSVMLCALCGGSFFDPIELPGALGRESTTM
jgi:hypothetical protein